MTDFVQPLLADVFLNGMAVLALGFVGYLCWLHFHEKRQERKREQNRGRDRRNHWDYE